MHQVDVVGGLARRCRFLSGSELHQRMSICARPRSPPNCGGDDESIPPVVEELLIDVMRSAGSFGGSAGGALGSGAAGSLTGGRAGAEKTARSMKTAVASRPAVFEGRPETIIESCRNALPRLQELAALDDRTRFLLPVGRTALQRVVVDVIATNSAAEADRTRLVIRAYAKEGLMSRKPAQRIADQVAAILATSE